MQYNDGVTQDGDLHVIKGEVSTPEANVIDAEGKAPRSLWCGASGHPPGTFPVNGTAFESHSPALYRSYCAFKRRAATNILARKARPHQQPVLSLRRLHLGHGYNHEEPQIVVSEYWLEFLPFEVQQGRLQPDGHNGKRQCSSSQPRAAPPAPPSMGMKNDPAFDMHDDIVVDMKTEPPPKPRKFEDEHEIAFKMTGREIRI